MSFSLSKATTKSTMATKQAGSGKRRKSPNSVAAAVSDVVELLDSDDDEARKPAAVASLLPAKRQKTETVTAAAAASFKMVKMEAEAQVSIAAIGIGPKNLFSDEQQEASLKRDDDEEGDDDDDVLIVEAPQNEFCPAAARASNNASNEHGAQVGDDDDIEMLGCTNQCRLPHLRQHCTEKKFVPLSILVNSTNIAPSSTLEAANNAQTCDLCYCYVCDTPVTDCQRWSSSTNTSILHNHCHASEKGPTAHPFAKLRELYKRHKGDATRVDEEYQCHNVPVAMRPYQEMTTRERLLHNYSRSLGAARLIPSLVNQPTNFLPEALKKGAFDPTDERIANYLRFLTKCRKCEYYSYTGGKRSDTEQHHLVEGSAEEWCQACGRVAPGDFTIKKNQCEPYQPKPTDVLLGTKTIPFTIKAHDPRNMNLFMAKWVLHENKAPNWTFSAAEMESDMFHHRIGAYPTIEMIFKSMPVLREDKIPKDGEQTQEDVFAKKNAFLEDTDAILMDRNSGIIIQELAQFRSVGFPKAAAQKDSMVVGDIQAKWNADERRGEFVVRVYFNEKGNNATLTRFLGAWFGLSAFPLSSLAGRMIATTEVNLTGCSPVHGMLPFPIPPFKHCETLIKESFEPKRDEMIAAVKKFNEEVEKATETLSLQSSLGKASRLGGVCLTDNSFSGMLRRYFTEMLPEAVVFQIMRKPSITWAGRALGVASYHRSMKNSTTRTLAAPGQFGGCFEFPHLSVESYVREEDLALCENIQKDCKAIFEQTKSMQGLLMHLENLGHGDSPFVEGLTVELLPFQRQTLQWALERETTPGGVQSFLWGRLPHVEDSKTLDVYFNPILDKVTTKKPTLVRGGIIADEMGLGKTVVSLGLILQNPAPLLPASGTKSSELTRLTPGWDPDCTPGNKSGSVLSRGTLVVCHLSLVGQWIEEAKSKLKDPGLVYAYHGQNRKRNPMILAKNSIVVTTYATLASDKFYKGYGIDNDNYCPPCETVRWWRIICDESHTLKSGSKQRQTVLKLIGDHKWAVSGTPWNTSLLDVKGQLQFLGIEYLDEMFQEFTRTVLDHIGQKRPRHNYRMSTEERKFGHFMFLMRAVMIRHSQKQQYRGTSTTLMSLPPKTERSIEIDFVGADIEEYEKLEKVAHDFYLEFRASHRQKLSSHYLKLMQALTPLRIACAGGRIPLTDDEEDEDGNEVDPDDDDDSPKKKKKRKEPVFSEYAFHSKCMALINELKRVRDEDPTSKSLIFSQYASSLKFLQEELPKQGFQYRTLSGDMSLKKRAEALCKFQKDPPTTIFLLSMRAGAVGINLTQANRVFMLEPAMNPALEAQALGRVYRLGQTRPVEIVRLLMKESIETRLRGFLDKKFGTSQKPSDSDESNGDAAAASTALVSNAIVGSLRTDRCTLMTEEFDLLFGVDGSELSSENDISGESHQDIIVPDCVGSDHAASGCI